MKQNRKWICIACILAQLLMLAACGKPVKYLKRLSMGNLTLDETLEKGNWRFLEKTELENLKKHLSNKENSKK